MSEVKSRICTKCKVEKEFSFFQKHKREKYGVMPKCKECENADSREKRRIKRVERDLANPEFIQNLELIGPKIHKTCTACNITKEITNFSKHKNYKGGHSTECKPCVSKRGCAIYHLSRDKAKNPDKYPDLPEVKSKICSKCKIDKEFNFYNKEKRGKFGFCSVCKPCRLDIYTRGRRSRPGVKERDNLHIRQRVKNDPQFALSLLLRSRVSEALKSVKARKSQKTIELVGCSIDQCKRHIEAQFLPGMTWENRGKYTWHLDHHLPVSMFNLIDPEEQKKAFHYTNLRPRWATTEIAKANGSNQIGNLNKSNKIIGVDFHEVLL